MSKVAYGTLSAQDRRRPSSSLDHDGRLFRLVFPRPIDRNFRVFLPSHDESRAQTPVLSGHWITFDFHSILLFFFFFFLQWKFFLFLLFIILSPFFLHTYSCTRILIHKYVDILIVRKLCMKCRWIKFHVFNFIVV